MDTKTLIKYGLIAIAAYIAYKKFLVPFLADSGLTTLPAPAPAQLPPAGGTTQPPVVTPPPPPPTQPAPPTGDALRIAMLQAAGVSATDRPTGYDGWNWYYHKVTGVQGPAYEDVYPWDQGGGSRGTIMTVNDYLGARGLAGIGDGFAGLGDLGRLALFV